jgi:hypothetical protein
MSLRSSAPGSAARIVHGRVRTDTASVVEPSEIVGDVWLSCNEDDNNDTGGKLLPAVETKVVYNACFGCLVALVPNLHAFWLF